MPTFRERLHVLYEEAKDKNYKVGRKGFANQLGITVPKVSAWLDGNGKPDFETLKLVAKNAGVSVSWLVGEGDLREIVLPERADCLPDEAQKEYHFILDYLKYKYGIHRQKPVKMIKKDQ